MIKYLRKYIKRTNKEDQTICQKIFGSDAVINQFATFWESSGDDLMLGAAVKLHEFLSFQDFTKEELIAYRKGQSDLAGLFIECWKEGNELD